MTPFLFLGGFYVGWNIGANDTANCVGTSVGSGLLSYRGAIVLVSLFVVIGGLLQGGNVAMTVGKGVVEVELPQAAVLVALISAGVFVTLATVLKLPVSTTQAIVGAVAGIGMAAGAPVNVGKLAEIAQVWVINPFLMALLSYAIYRVATSLMRRVRYVELWDRLMGVLVLFSVAYMAFSLGANHVGTTIGPLVNLGFGGRWLILFGGLAIATGVLTFSRGVTETLSGSITVLDPLSAFSAQAAAAMGVHLFSILGIPVSTSQAVVGAVVGVGIVKGIRAISRRRVLEILIGWVATPTTAGLLAFGLYRLVGYLGGA
ncbi:MAG: inorganic phosphate transporter [Caldiserica bacterium]|nr:inorganic phosphate transporter [Caldisericota bacterium]